ncbi:MAG: hypothetical protein QME81_07445 [bacterium]|nr:hypothetical protein [bacterium]
MCGICGILDFNRRIDRDSLDRMCDAVKHRGPDDEGIYISEGIGLGHRRLAIIDLESGHQPMANEDESVWIVYNGEIYNHKILRELASSKFSISA